MRTFLSQYFFVVVVFVVFFKKKILHAQKHLQPKINQQNKNKLTLNNKGNNFSRVKTFKRMKVAYFALVYIDI